MSPARSLIPQLLVGVAVLLIALITAAPARAQGVDPEGRLVREVKFEGLNKTPKELVVNAVRTAAGQPYKDTTVSQDIVRLTFLGRFDTVQAKVEENKDDGSINVIFALQEQKTLAAIRFKGASHFDEEELEDLALLEAGDAIDGSLIERGSRAIKIGYSLDGYFAASVTYDKKLLATKQELVYLITEGPLVRVVEMRYEGNKAFTGDQLQSRVRSDTYSWPFVSGFMNRDELQQDVDAIRKFYKDRGYLKAEVGRRIELSEKQDRAVVTFEVSEGKKHVVRDIKIKFSKDGAPTKDQLMSEDQIRLVVDLVRGGVYADQRLASSREKIRMWYGEIGFINTLVQIDRVFDPDQGLVDVVVQIDEGVGPTRVGDVTIIGLDRTDQKVLLRRIRGLEPGRPVNLRGLEQTRNLVQESVWFSNGTITPLGSPDDPIRDFLIEAKEKNTGSFSIGAGLSSDAGVFGAISLTQRNFDITDWPESFDEFIAQRAFLGAGQTFNITLAPGNRNSTYAVSFSEPYLFETDYFFDISLSSFDSVREDFDEGRLTVNTSLGRRLGDIWTGRARVRAEQIDISTIEADAPVDVFAVGGDSTLTALGFTLLRSTTDSNITPGEGSRISITVDQFGALGGDYDFTRFNVGYDQFWTLDKDFLGRKTILSFKIDAGYIPQDTADVPVFERFYAGGRGFRGFGFRGVGPTGIRNDNGLLGDDPVGGRFRFTTRAQYEFPVYDELIRWAVFTDQGTVQDDLGFDQWRVAVGTGIRLNLPFFGQAPIAIDLGFPLVKEDRDDTQLISFSFELPFN